MPRTTQTSPLNRQIPILSVAGLLAAAAWTGGCSTGGLAVSTNQPQPSVAVATVSPAIVAEPTPSYAPSAEPARAASVRAESAAATANVARVTFAEEGADFDPSVSRDGSRLVFASTQHRATSDIYVKRSDSRVVTQLTTDPAEDAMPEISPDGTRIAFASNRAGNWDVYVMPLAGGKAVQITSEGTDEVHPSWSPDGRSLVFSRFGGQSDRWELWVAQTANPSVANFIGYGLLPRWCPVAGTGADGMDRILFQLSRERGRRSFGLWTVDYADGSATNATEVAGSVESALINPAWSPDGRWIVYAETPAPALGAENSVTDGTTARVAEASLWMLSVEGEGRVRLTEGGGLALSPTWGGNNRLFFVSNRGGSDNVWSLDLSPAIVAANAVTGGAGFEPTHATARAPAHSTPGATYAATTLATHATVASPAAPVMHDAVHTPAAAQPETHAAAEEEAPGAPDHR